MFQVMLLATVAFLVAMYAWTLYVGHGLDDAAFILRAWQRVLSSDPPSPEELHSLLGPALELVGDVTEDVATGRGDARDGVRAILSRGPARSVTGALYEAEARTSPVADLLLDWTVGLSWVRELESPRPLAVRVLRLRRLQALALLERPMRLIGRCFTQAAPVAHLATLRWALRLLVRALRDAQRARPDQRERLLEAIRADFALIADDCVRSHAAVIGPFLRWRASCPEFTRIFTG